MSSSHPVHFANFICHVGQAELADALQNIVIPAFETKQPRAFRDIRYHLHEVVITKLDMQDRKNVPVIMGRLIKDMVVRSEQQFEQNTGVLKKSRQQMHSSPSSVFVLILDTPKLIFCHETSGAPGLDAFKSTISSFMSSARKEYIQRIQKVGITSSPEIKDFLYRCSPEELSTTEIQEELKKPTLKLLRKLVLNPSLEVVPLSNEESLREFVERFKVLDLASVRLLRRNSEIDNDEFFEQIRNKGDSAGADISTITYKNKNGLVKSQVITQLESALTGNAEVQLSGKDETDLRIRGTNEEFKAVAKIREVPTLITIAARSMYGIFNDYVTKGHVKVAKSQHSDRQIALINSIVQTHTQGTADGHESK